MSREMYKHLIPTKSPKEMLPTAPRYFTKLKDTEFGRKVSYKMWMDALPYRSGDVVLTQIFNNKGKALIRKAFIVNIFVERDSMQERIPKYQVLVETGAGNWSKNFQYLYSGMIYRGYRLKDKIPDFTEKGRKMDRD